MTRIYLIRHAEAEGNLCRRFHGQFDTNVTPNGMAQIRELAKRFQTVKVDAVYSSDLTRTQTTAQAITLQKNLPLQLDSRFREVSLGVCEDLPFGYLKTFRPEVMEAFVHDCKHWSVPGGEIYPQYTGRFLEALHEVTARHPGETVAIFSHGSILSGVLMALFPNRVIAHSENTAVSCLEEENGSFSPLYLGDASHLQAEGAVSSQKWWLQKDRTLWFQPGLTDLEDCPGCPGEETYTAMECREPVGTLTLQGEGEDARLVHVGLVPSRRGCGLAIQLLGQAVFMARAKKKRSLLVQVPPETPSLGTACRKLGFLPGEGGAYALDLAVRIKPL